MAEKLGESTTMFPNVIFLIKFVLYSSQSKVNSTIFKPVKEETNSVQTVQKLFKEIKF